jgi:hypothetical protein
VLGRALGYHRWRISTVRSQVNVLSMP